MKHLESKTLKIIEAFKEKSSKIFFHEVNNLYKRFE